MIKRYQFSNERIVSAGIFANNKVMVKGDNEWKTLPSPTETIPPQIHFSKKQCILSYFGGFTEVKFLNQEQENHSSMGSNQQIMVPMPGKVVSIKVKEGDVVEEDTCLVVVEAMKMENNIYALGNAIVEKIHVEKGQLLSAGSLLITLKENNEGSKNS